MVGEISAELGQFFGDFSKAFFGFAFEANAGVFCCADFQGHNALLSFIQGVPCFAVAQGYKAFVDGSALAHAQAKGYHFGEDLLMSCSEFILVLDAEQVADWAPCIFKRHIERFEGSDNTFPGWRNLLLYGFKLPGNL